MTMKFPKHEAGLTLTHNDFRGYYQTAAEWLEDGNGIKPTWESEEERLRAIDKDDIWTLQWYPNNPVGFNYIAASTLESLLEYASKH